MPNTQINMQQALCQADRNSHLSEMQNFRGWTDPFFIHSGKVGPAWQLGQVPSCPLLAVKYIVAYPGEPAQQSSQEARGQAEPLPILTVSWQTACRAPQNPQNPAPLIPAAGSPFGDFSEGLRQLKIILCGDTKEIAGH